MNSLKFGAYFFPHSFACPERQRLSRQLGHKLESEIELAHQAKPLFDGHKQPAHYCLGDKKYLTWDDANPKDMARQVELAIQYGIDFFVFDTYIGYKNGRYTREWAEPLDDVFLKLNVAKKMKFALMLSMASSRIVVPIPKIRGFVEETRYFDYSPETAEAIVDECAQKYWKRENYLRINGKPYVSVFPYTIDGPENEERKAQYTIMLDHMRKYALTKYQTEIYIAGLIRRSSDALQHQATGVDALTGYSFLPQFDESKTSPIQEFNELLARRKKDWVEISETASIPFVPPALTGWDASARGVQNCQLKEVAGIYPFTPIVVNTSPSSFKIMLTETIEHIKTHVPVDERYVMLCAWNEVGEGISLLPRIEEGKVSFSYLEQLKKVKEEYK